MSIIGVVVPLASASLSPSLLHSALCTLHSAEEGGVRGPGLPTGFRNTETDPHTRRPGAVGGVSVVVLPSEFRVQRSDTACHYLGCRQRQNLLPRLSCLNEGRNSQHRTTGAGGVVSLFEIVRLPECWIAAPQTPRTEKFPLGLGQETRSQGTVSFREIRPA
ncbi:hypothetical protein BO71DRAFT_36500 [Aspergillus ellipticus CBS 707.79]|uniref:Uncharacterized protein n=1 Tax=Aspergillus ellipticus CBS 707.79 TaxID=1448320 RepID=A0A319DV19_9EURO|nr:hypothetical protein BO71DRAFT_36500 [Aspergillus ellipticus CBS 707.79]